MIFIFLLVMPKYEGKQNVSIVREKERRRNTPGIRVGPGFLFKFRKKNISLYSF